MFKKNYFYIVFFTCFNCCILFGQQLPYIRYNTHEGLPSSQVYNILQDKKGFLWFATDNGISRFDGYKFKNYSVSDGLKSSVAFTFCEDALGRIWFAHDNFKLSYWQNDTIKEFKYNHIVPSQLSGLIKGNNFIIDVKVDALENIFLIYQNGMAYCITNKGDLLKLSKDNTKSINVVYNAAAGVSYINTNKLNEENSGNNFTFYVNNNSHQVRIGSDNILYRNIKTLYFNKNKFVFSMGNQLFVHNNDSLWMKKLDISSVINLGKEGNDLWVTAYPGHGIEFYKNADIRKPPVKTYLNGVTVSSYLRDNEGGMWFVTNDDGVFYLRDEKYQNMVFSSDENSNKCTELFCDNNFIFAGVSKNNIYKIRNGMPEKLNKNPIPYLGRLVYHNNALWVFSTNELYQIYYNGKCVVKDYYDIKNERVKQVFVNNFYAYSDSILFLSGSRGFNIYKIGKNKDIIINGFIDTTIRKVYVSGFCHFKDRKVLAATKNGLYCIIADTVNFLNTRWQYLGSQNPLFKSRIDRIVYNEYDKRYWMATKERGFLMWDELNDTIFTLTKKDGLPDDLITSLVCKDNFVFAGTKYGLVQVVLNQKEIVSLKTFVVKGGLHSSEVRDIVVKDSLVYTATDNGVYYFNYHLENSNYKAPPIYITKFKINDIDTILSSNYTLPYYQNNISIEYVGIAYKSLGSITYKFNLKGIDNQWNFTNLTDIGFYRLQPGNYTFSVYAKSEEGVWSERPAVIHFTIMPPFWARWWFKAAIVLIIAFIIIILVQMKLKEIEKRNQIKIFEAQKRHQLEQELVHSRLTALSHQMNPHFVFNTLSAAQLMAMNGENERMMDYISKFVRLMRMTLSFSREEFCTAAQMNAYIAAFVEIKSINLEEAIKFEIVIDENIDVNQEIISPIIAQPYIENAIIHGLIPKRSNMKLKIDMKLEHNNIIFVIEDNGIGRQKALELNEKRDKIHKSYGIQITEERIELLNMLYKNKYLISIFDLYDSEGNAAGTKIVLNFPLLKNN